MDGLTKDDAGCWVDSANGIHTLLAVLAVCRIAERYGWDGLRGPMGAYAEWQREGGGMSFAYWFAHGYQFASEDMDEAENYMQDFAPDGFYFGANKHTSDWGLWAYNEEDE